MKAYVLAALAVLVLPSMTFAQAQSSEQQVCINFYNKGMAKVASAQGKACAKCVAGFARGDVADLAACYNADPRVDDATHKVCSDSSFLCPVRPTIGPDDCNGVALNTKYTLKQFAQEIFDVDQVASCESDAAWCKCQANVLKSALKLLDTRLKTFNTCKKSGLRDPDAPFASNADIENCLTLDPKLQIENAQVKLDVAIDRSCNGIASPFAGGSCAGLTGTPLRNCLDMRTRCRACWSVEGSDHLSADCDLYDDAIANSSCSFSAAP